MISVKQVQICIEKLLIPYADCVAWEEFGEKNDPCYDQNHFINSRDARNIAFTMALVRLAMPKGERNHVILAKKVAKHLGMNYVWYDWLVKAVGRILSGTNYSDLKQMLLFSNKVKQGMKEKKLSSITSIEEVIDYVQNNF